MLLHFVFFALIQDGSSAEQCDVNPQVLCSRIDSMREQQTRMVHQMNAMRLQMTEMMTQMDNIKLFSYGNDLQKDLHEKHSKLIFKRIHNLQRRVHQLETRNQKLEQRVESRAQYNNGIEEGSYLKKRNSESDDDVFLKKPSVGSVMEGEDYEMECQVNAPVSTCIWISPEVLNVYPQPEGKRYKLVGKALEKGGCSIRIMNVSMDHAGVWTCNPDIGNSHSPSAAAQLKVLKRPDSLRNLLIKIEKANERTEICENSIQELNTSMATIKEFNQRMGDQCLEELKKLQKETQQKIDDLRNKSQTTHDRLDDNIDEVQVETAQRLARFEEDLQSATVSMKEAGDAMNTSIGKFNTTIKRRIKKERRFHNRQHLWYALKFLENKGYTCSGSAHHHHSWRCYRIYPGTLITHTAALTYCHRDGAALLTSTSTDVAALLSNITTTCDYEQQGLCYVWVDMEDFSCDEDTPCKVVNVLDHRKSCVDCRKCYGVICQADVRAVTALQWRRWDMTLRRRKKKLRDALGGAERTEVNEVRT